MGGRLGLTTRDSTHTIDGGDIFALGANRWCSITPHIRSRIWTLYVDELFLRFQMKWILPIAGRIKPGSHPVDWNGSVVTIHVDDLHLRGIEALCRQLSILPSLGLSPEKAAARSVSLFAQMAELTAERLVDESAAGSDEWLIPPRIVLGKIAKSEALWSPSHRAAQLLQQNIDHSWTVDSLAREVALSRTHLARSFSKQFGIPPMRYLTEIRLTEFTRLIEETDLTVSAASRSVGWRDSRVAASWFRRRFGVAPSQFRKTPHPSTDTAQLI